MNRPSGSGNASGAAWNDPMDLHCTEHTERQRSILILRYIETSWDFLQLPQFFFFASLHVHVINPKIVYIEQKSNEFSLSFVAKNTGF